MTEYRKRQQNIPNRRRESSVEIIEIDSTVDRNFSRRKTDPSFDREVTQNEKKVIKKPEGLYLNFDGCKAAQIIAILNHFIFSMTKRWSTEVSKKFQQEIQLLLDYLGMNHESYKTSRADSLAVCYILLVGSKLGLSKKDFVECLKLQKLAMVEHISRIKKTRCYLEAKRAFIDILKAKK